MKNYAKKSLKASNGITLIALVITIIVLLILAGISIGMLTGNNGILKQSRDAKERTGIAEVVENAKLDVLAQIAENNGENISKDQLKTILNKYFEGIDALELPDDLSNSDLKLNANQQNGGYKNIALSEIYNGSFSNLKDGSDVQLKVGDYVKYGDKLTATTYTTDTSETGYTSTQTFATNTSMLWRVFSVDENKVELVATQNVLANDNTTGLYLNGQTGFLNAETVLKKLCERLYNSTSGTARSIKVDDINNLTGYDPETSEDYNKPFTYTEGGPFWEKASNTFKPVNSTVTVYYDLYYYTVNNNIPLYDTLIAESKTYSGNYSETNYPLFYWLDSRIVDNDDSSARFLLHSIDSGDVSYWQLFEAYTYSDEHYENAYACAVRPIVTLNSGIQIRAGDGSQATPYEL